jgi:hypothetical protein
MAYNFLGNQENTLIQSGGGVFRPEKGIYGIQSERTDIFGGSRPLTEQTYGNMYSNGPSFLEGGAFPNYPSSAQLPYEFQARSEMEKEGYNLGIGDYKNPATLKSFQRRMNSKNSKESFALPQEMSVMNDTSSIGNSNNMNETTELDESSYEILPTISHTDLFKFNKWFVIFLFIILMVIGSYWVKTTDFVLYKYLFKEQRPTLNQLVGTTLGLTAIFVVLYFIGEKYF